MDTQDGRVDKKLVRTSVMVSEDTDRALREIAEKAHRPLTWEIRLALEAHVAREAKAKAA